MDINSINKVLEKYIDFKDLYLRMDFRSEPIIFLDHPDEDTLLLQFNNPIVEDRIQIYTLVRERFIDFDLEVVSPAEPKYPKYSYLMRIRDCSIALDKREYKRTQFAEELPLVSNIATIKVREHENDFRKSLSVRMITEEFVNRLEGVDFKKVVFKDDKDIPPTVEFVMASGSQLHIEDTSDLSGFFEDHEKFFRKKTGLGDALRTWIMSNTKNMKSILVRPIYYHPLIGEEFPIAYLTAINKERSIDAGQAERIDGFVKDLSERIRNGNLLDSKTGGRIIDISEGGAKIELTDSQLIEKLASQNVVMLELNFKEDSPLRISGNIVYVYKLSDGRCMLGIDFRGSRFGPRFISVLPNHVRHFLFHRKH